MSLPHCQYQASFARQAANTVCYRSHCICSGTLPSRKHLTETYCAKRQQQHRCRKSGRGRSRPDMQSDDHEETQHRQAQENTFEIRIHSCLERVGASLKPNSCPLACWLATYQRGVAAPHVVLLRLPGSPQDVQGSSGRAF